MKHFLLFVILTQIVATTFGQLIWNMNFEDTTYQDRIIIDTTFDDNNIWQIGKPDKLVFNNAYSTPNVIVTDTSQSYPINDTSSFIVIHIASEGWANQYEKIDIGGWYFVNTDTLTDYGFIDFSTDMGNTWCRVDSSLGICSWGASEELPVFSGNSNGWEHFYYCLHPPVQINMGDTVLYRFTFISDSIQTNKDGLMFDNLHFEDWAEGIEEIGFDLIKSKCLPNPAKDELSILFSNKENSSFDIYVFDIFGNEIYNSKTNSDIAKLSLVKYNSGTYFYKLVDKNNRKFTIGKFVKE